MKKTAIALAFALLMTMTGCASSNFSQGTSGGVSGGVYANADNYNIGDFTYDASQVTALNIYWLSGSVELVQSDGATLTVSETHDGLDQDHQLRWLLEDGVLTIQFWRSNFSSLQDLTGLKQLTVELPRGIKLTANSVSAPISAGELELAETKFQTSSGAVTLDSLSCPDFSANTVSGNVTVGTLATGSAKADTTSGAVSLGLAQCTGLELGTVSGPMELTLLEGMDIDVEFSSVSGELNVLRDALDVNVSGACPVSAKSTSGSLTIK